MEEASMRTERMNAALDQPSGAPTGDAAADGVDKVSSTYYTKIMLVPPYAPKRFGVPSV
jgi:hypothetical protein